MSRKTPCALYLAASCGVAAILAASFLTIGRPATEDVTENVTSTSPAAPVPAAPSLASSSASGAIGATFTAHGPGTACRIGLAMVTQQATLGAYESLMTAGDHIAAAEFTVTGKTGLASDDPDLAAVAMGSNGAIYLPDDKDLAAGAGFQGQFTIGRGQSRAGWVTFELPPGVAVTRIQWRPAFGTGALTWTVPAEKGPSPHGVDRGH